MRNAGEGMKINCCVNAYDRLQNITLVFQAYSLSCNLSSWALMKWFNLSHIFLCHRLTLKLWTLWLNILFLPDIAFLSNEKDSIWLIYPVSNILTAENLPWQFTNPVYMVSTYHSGSKIQQRSKRIRWPQGILAESLFPSCSLERLSGVNVRAMAPAAHHYSLWGCIRHILEQ